MAVSEPFDWGTRFASLAKRVPQSKYNGHYFVRPTLFGIKQHAVKAAAGRGRRISKWSLSLSNALLEDFDGYRKAGVKINSRILRLMALKLINSDENVDFASFVMNDRSGKSIKEHIPTRSAQHFMQTHNIVSRSQTGKQILSPDKQELIERSVAYHLGKL